MIGRMLAVSATMNKSHGHYEGGLVNGARILHFWEDLGRKLAEENGDDMPFVKGFDNIEFTAPVHVGDDVEYIGWIEEASDEGYCCRFEAWKSEEDSEKTLCGKALGIVGRLKDVKRAVGHERRSAEESVPNKAGGQVVRHRMMMSAKDVKYPGDMVNCGRMVDNWGDVGTEIVILADGDIGLFLGYKKIRFTAPVYAGDFVEYTGWLEKVGSRSYTCHFEAWKTAGTLRNIDGRSEQSQEVQDFGPTAAGAYNPPIKCGEAQGTLYIASGDQRGPQREDFEDVVHP